MFYAINNYQFKTSEAKQFKPLKSLGWTGNVHFSTICEIIFLVSGPWKLNVVLEKSLKNGCNFLYEPWSGRSKAPNSQDILKEGPIVQGSDGLLVFWKNNAQTFCCKSLISYTVVFEVPELQEISSFWNAINITAHIRTLANDFWNYLFVFRHTINPTLPGQSTVTKFWQDFIFHIVHTPGRRPPWRSHTIVFCCGRGLELPSRIAWAGNVLTNKARTLPPPISLTFSPVRLLHKVCPKEKFFLILPQTPKKHLRASRRA